MHRRIARSFWAFHDPLGVSIKKTLQTAGYQFTVYGSGFKEKRKKKKDISSNKPVLFILCSQNPVQKVHLRFLYVSHVNYPHLVFPALSSKCKMSKMIDL